MSVGTRGYAGFVPSETGGSGGGSGTVTSVDVAITGYTSSGAVTASGTVTMTEGAQSGNKVKASPSDGSSGIPAYRALVAADIPSLSSVYQPLDADLTAIAALSTTSYGRGFLPLADAAAALAYIGASGSLWTDGVGITYLTDTADDLAVGGTTLTSSAFSCDVSAKECFIGGDVSLKRQAATLLRIGDGTTATEIGAGADPIFGQTGQHIAFFNGATKRGMLAAIGSGLALDYGSLASGGLLSANGTQIAVWKSDQFSMQVTQKLGLDAAYGGAGCSHYWTASAQGSGNISRFYNSAEVFRDDGTNLRDLASRRHGAYLTIGDAVPSTRYGGNHKIITTAVPSTATTSEEDLITYAIPAALMTTTNDRVDYAFVFTFAATARTKRIRIYFGATVVYDTGAVLFNGGQATIYATVIRTGATTQVAIGTFNGDVTLITQLASFTTPTETLANAITVKSTSTVGAGASANDVICKMMVHDFFPVGA